MMSLSDYLKILLMFLNTDVSGRRLNGCSNEFVVCFLDLWSANVELRDYVCCIYLFWAVNVFYFAKSETEML